MKVQIMSRKQFEEQVLYNNSLSSSNFYISILDPGVPPYHEDSINYKSFSFYDIFEDIKNYEAISYKQAREIVEFIIDNYGKDLIVHCNTGKHRSAAVAEYYHELLGGSYKDLLSKYPDICPNGRVLYMLRCV